jgi:dihydroflavonol-4-reductase
MQSPFDDWGGRKVAVTGATGFVGHHLVVQLRQLGATVIALVRSTSATDRLRALGCECRTTSLDDPAGLTCALQGAELVFHVAAAVDFGHDFAKLHAINVGGTCNVIEAARRARVRRLIHTSSIVAVGCSDRPEPLDENTDWNLARYKVPYFLTKRQAEEAALAANGSDLEVVVGNPGCVVGPDDYSRSEFGTLCRRFWRGQVPFYFAGGTNLVDVRDVADGLIRLAQFGRPGRRYLLTGHNQTFGEFMRALAEAAKRRYLCLPLPGWSATWLSRVVNLVPTRPGTRPILSPETARLMGRFFFFDASRARNELGWQARPLAQTLQDAYAFWMPSKAA